MPNLSGTSVWSPEDERESERNCGSAILDSMRSLDRDIDTVRNRITYLERRREVIRKVVKLALWTAIIGLVAVSVCRAETASFYTYNSCVREGTSGVWTASGERFNENDYTCASWDYRFGTLLRVTNIHNNRSVVVRVNDRGPAKKLYRKGRKIDLSYKAMDALGGINKGIIEISVVRVN